MLGFAKSTIARDWFAIPNYGPRQSVAASSRSPRGDEIWYAGVAGLRRWDDGVALGVAHPCNAIPTGFDESLAYQLQVLQFVRAPHDCSVAAAPHPPNTIDPMKFLLRAPPLHNLGGQLLMRDLEVSRP